MPFGYGAPRYKSERKDVKKMDGRNLKKCVGWGEWKLRKSETNESVLNWPSSSGGWKMAVNDENSIL